uniref:Putative Kinase n=1 Tax=Davidia involucrata TaxID=16924 RepID=A0A5B7BDM1_DAVIN
MLEIGTSAILIFLLVMIFLRLSLGFRKCSEGRRSGLCSYPQGSKFVAPAIDKVLDEIEKPIRFSSQQLRIATDNFSHLLGAGGFGAVYKGTFSSGLVVAVKVLNGSSDKRIEDQFLAEVSTIGRTHHINLVQLYGFCFDKDLRSLVYEYMENSSLDRLLFSKDEIIEWEKLHGIAIGTAKGIAYLHEDCQQRIIHYDIKPENILLDVEFCPKVADFGLAKLCNREKTHVTLTAGRGTPGYAAPEMWMPFPITHKCDVYSFGMLLFEILGRRRNLDVNLPDSQEWFPRWVWKKYEKGEFPDVMFVCGIEDKDKEKAGRMAMAALWCVQYCPERRPWMSAVVKALEGVVEIPTPKNPFRHLMAGSPPPDLVAEVKKGLCTSHNESTLTSTVPSHPCSTAIMRKYEIEIATT